GMKQSGLRDLLAAESEQLAGETSGALRGLQNLAAIAAQFFFPRQARLQQFRVSANDSEQIVEVVSHAAGQSSYGLHFLCLQEFGLQFALLSAVQLHAENALLVADSHKRPEIQAHALVAFSVFKFNLHVLDRAFRGETFVKLVAVCLRFPESQLHTGLA